MKDRVSVRVKGVIADKSKLLLVLGIIGVLILSLGMYIYVSSSEIELRNRFVKSNFYLLTNLPLADLSEGRAFNMSITLFKLDFNKRSSKVSWLIWFNGSYPNNFDIILGFNDKISDLKGCAYLLLYFKNMNRAERLPICTKFNVTHFNIDGRSFVKINNEFIKNLLLKKWKIEVSSSEYQPQLYYIVYTEFSTNNLIIKVKPSTAMIYLNFRLLDPEIVSKLINYDSRRGYYPFLPNCLDNSFIIINFLSSFLETSLTKAFPEPSLITLNKVMWACEKQHEMYAYKPYETYLAFFHVKEWELDVQNKRFISGILISIGINIIVTTVYEVILYRSRT